MNLIIVESPTKARTLSRFLGKEYSILPTMGHIRDLPKDKLGIDVDKDFEPSYVAVKGRKDTVKQLKDEAKKAEVVFLATDPDREGEAIAYHVKHMISSNSKIKVQSSKFRRIVFHEITQSAIKEAVAHPRDLDMQLVNAQQARRILDRLVGYKLSPLLWYKVRKGLSAGRVQSVAVRLIVEREREIEAFKPVEYWLIEAKLQKDQISKIKEQNEQGTFIARLIEKNGKKIEVNNKIDADTIVADLQNAQYVVGEVKKKESKRNPYAPFTTSTMQQTASNRFGWSAKKSMQLAQALYEEGLITYHRTDSTNIAAEALPPLREFISTVYGPEYIPESPRLYKTKSKVAQEAHEAIRPTNSRMVAPNDAKVVMSSNLEHKILPDHVGRDGERLYSLIWRRFVASQMTEAIFDQTSVDIKAHIYTLRANGSVIKFDGWRILYDENQISKIKNQNDNAKEKNDEGLEESIDTAEENHLPQLEEGEKLNLEKLLPQQKFTEPPPRFNEASLIKALEERGIGRPSTYAPTISTIQDRQYVEKREKRFYPTPLGSAVNDFLVKNFANIIDYDFTAKMEDKLDNIANGEEEWVPTIREFFTPFNDRISVVYKDADRVKIVTEQIDELCPTCNNPLVVRLGKFGKFIACSTYPACKYTRQFVEKTGIACPKCGGEMIMRKTKHGKQFYGCGNYPTCDFAAWKKEDIIKSS